MESNITLIRNLGEDNKMYAYKHVSEILRQNFSEVTRGFSERAVEGDCDTGLEYLCRILVGSLTMPVLHSQRTFSKSLKLGRFHFLKAE